jgi:uncharacterized membrane-anchored protein
MMTRIIIALVIQTALLGGMVGMKQYTLNTGQQILLETEPIDPRSLFRGDYVRLNYVISNLEIEELDGDKDFKRHDEVFVTLQQQGDYWQAHAVQHQRPAVDPGRVIIKGKIKYVSNTRWNRETRTSEPVKNIRLRYGIENYFVPEGEGRGLERRDAGKVDIRVAVDKYGNIGIKAVLVNGEERYVESLL